MLVRFVIPDTSSFTMEVARVPNACEPIRFINLGDGTGSRYDVEGIIQSVRTRIDIKDDPFVQHTETYIVVVGGVVKKEMDS